MNLNQLKTKIRTIPHWPKQGVMFRDITTLLLDPQAFNYCVRQFKKKYSSSEITKIAGIESRGFIFGAALASAMKLPFVLIRKKGKLPGEKVSMEYDLEYGKDIIEMHRDALTSSDKVLLMDDLLATGGTMLAACRLVEKVGAKVESCAVVVNLPELKGAERIKQYNPFHLVDFEGE